MLDRLFDIETARHVDHDGLGFDEAVGSPYVPSNWFNMINLYRLLRRLPVSSDDTFADFGCGKGLVLLLAGRFPFRKVIGIDLSAAMLEAASRNIERRNRPSTRRRFELVHGDAAAYPIPPDLSVCYFYMPFPTPIYDAVVANLEASATSHPREIRLVYLHPRPEDAAVPARHGFREVRRVRNLVLYSNGATDGTR